MKIFRQFVRKTLTRRRRRNCKAFYITHERKILLSNIFQRKIMIVTEKNTEKKRTNKLQVFQKCEIYKIANYYKP